ncbi:GRIM19 NADH ubiquinone oxidoreductase [Agaricus bisporus var. bisporus H97]|uniref:GRIM19 NADH ubiquinone oxidoreductase n=1 Tax=Agaricus bisporus var. bisporus (strain H97 / ATCC MYA-4626 / FGSC 10389) TaxID=936046 RepID=UPI00029F552C|nr:GRIM19 NADH ubiquinone oxidoreductase [Agaricus bisporus var. bisporus H97]EKV42485.1 GRIM19 NADH ubiquinone oxidoreductase [Agaricus bisporus var. bisporus H97]
MTQFPTVSVPYRQDMPPSGGFEAIKYKRNLPFRGPGGLAILGGVTAICAYGFYRVGKGNLEKRELRREKAWSRIHLVPLLLAESDRDAYRREQAALAREREIMKDVPGWEVGRSVYSSSRYRSPEIAIL